MALQKEEWLTYDFPTSIRHLLSESVKQFKGQTQKWYTMSYAHSCKAPVCCIGFISVIQMLQSQSSRLEKGELQDRFPKCAENFVAGC